MNEIFVVLIIHSNIYSKWFIELIDTWSSNLAKLWRYDAQSLQLKITINWPTAVFLRHRQHTIHCSLFYGSFCERKSCSSRQFYRRVSHGALIKKKKKPESPFVSFLFYYLARLFFLFFCCCCFAWHDNTKVTFIQFFRLAS